MLAPHRYITCASPEYLQTYGEPQTIAALAQHKLLAFRHRGSNVPWNFKTEQGKVTHSIQGRLVLSDTEAILDAALQGKGICQLGAFLVGEHIRHKQLQPVLVQYSQPGPPVCAFYPTKRYLLPKVRLFLQLFDEYWKGLAIWS